jgi:hypothetical protein
MLAALVVALLLLPAVAGAEIRLPPGFTAEIYVTGTSDTPDGGSATGIPSTSSLAFDQAGMLYAARSGRRYVGGEIEDLWPVFRFPPGGARLTRDTVARFFYGPPLFSVQVGAVRDNGELLVTTYDRDRGLGVLYRISEGRAELLAGGTPPRGEPPQLKQPEAVAIDGAGHIYVADRPRGVVLRLDASGRVLDPAWFAVPRPRLLAARGDRVWVASDGDAEAPWQPGTGEIWSLRGADRRVVLRGPIVAGMAVAPGGQLFVADRRNARIVALGDDGVSAEIVTFANGDAPRAVAWAPATEATRRAGIAGDLFVAVIRRGMFQVNEIVRISGPFEDLLRTRLPAR